MEEVLNLVEEIREFAKELSTFLYKNLLASFLKFEEGKGIFVSLLYRQRGRFARQLVHTGMGFLAGVGILIAPLIAQEFPGRSVDPWNIPYFETVLSASTENSGVATLFAEGVRDKIEKYTVREGDTVSSIAEKFGVSEETVLWQNNLTSKGQIKTGQELEMLPVTGVAHKVVKGDTVYSISKKYDASSQAIVDFPFNTFTNDETFDLAIGQVVIVPDGVAPKDVPAAPRTRQLTPDAGSVVASGSFVWPAGGTISQRFVWYHKGLDIANRASPNVLASDAGRVVTAGWPDGSGYGNRVIIDHGNGFVTLYAHLSRIFVVPGQTVGRGAAIGQMGSTGRSTGTHLHFEVVQNGVKINPLNILR